MRRRDRPLRQLVLVLLLVSWVTSALALATAKHAPPDLTGLPALQLVLAACVSLVGALTRTVQRAINDGARPGFSLRRELVRDVLASIAIAVATYSYGAIREWSEWELSIALVVLGYGGVTVLDRLLALFKVNLKLPPEGGA